MLEGLKIIHRMGLALLARAEPSLLSLPFEPLLLALRGVATDAKMDADELLRSALSFRLSRRLDELSTALEDPQP